jgi:hypothetical protein
VHGRRESAMNFREANALSELIHAASRGAKIGMVAGGSWRDGIFTPEVVHGEARYIGGKFTDERDFAAEATADVMDLFLVIRVYSTSDYTDIPHPLRDILAKYLAGSLVVDYEV